MSVETPKCILIKPTDSKKRDYNVVLILKDSKAQQPPCPREMLDISCKDCPRASTCAHAHDF